MTTIAQKTNDESINLALDTISIGKQALLFANTKASAEATAEKLSIQVKKGNPRLKTLDEISEKILHSLSRPTKQCERLANIVKYGVAFHHAGLTTEQKMIIEEKFKEGAIKIICCTPTLCISSDSKVWSGMSEINVSNLKNSNSISVLSKRRIINMKPQKIEKNSNSSKLVYISSVSGYSIKVTPNHKILIKRGGKKYILPAKWIRKTDRIATIGRINLNKNYTPFISDFVRENKLPGRDVKLNSDSYYLIGAMLGDGYSGAQLIGNKTTYKGSPMIVGIDKEIFFAVKKTCNRMKISTREGKSGNNVPQLALGKNKWFREFLCRCGVNKGTNKRISQKLMIGSLEDTRSLLRGLFDTDGCVELKGRISFSNVSEDLIKQIQKLLLRFGIVSSIRKKPAASIKIYEKEYQTQPAFELIITNKRSILDFYRFIGFNIKRKEENLIRIVVGIASNINYCFCKECKYKIYFDLFKGRNRHSKIWGEEKLRIIRLLGKMEKLGSKEIKKQLGFNPRKGENRLNHHYELIKKKRIGSRTSTELVWSLNDIGRWVYNNIVLPKRGVEEFLKIYKCPLCGKELDFFIKKGWRDSDFEHDIFWDIIREINEVEVESDVYDVVLPDDQNNDHIFVANGFLVHNSAGVDLPAFRTILRDLKRYTFRGMDWIPVLEYQQMCGRAGRPSFDKFGEAIAIAKTEPERDEIEDRYIEGEVEDIYSKLAVEPVLRSCLLSLIASGFANSKKQLMEFFEKTFWAFQFKDMFKLEAIIDKILGMLEDWGFIYEKGEKIEPTLIGKRVAELYIDPYTANFIIECLKKAGSKQIKAISFLQMACRCLEMRPLLRTRVKEVEEIEEKLVGLNGILIDSEPSVFEPDYDEFIDSVKTASFLEDWTEEKDEEYLLETYKIRPGEIRAKLELGDWILYCAEELARMINLKELLKEISKTRFRLKYGVKEELLALLKLRDIGRVRARKLHNHGIRDLRDVKAAQMDRLIAIIGAKTAASIKEQVGIVVDKGKLKVKENKRKGQISLRDY